MISKLPIAPASATHVPLVTRTWASAVPPAAGPSNVVFVPAISNQSPVVVPPVAAKPKSTVTGVNNVHVPPTIRKLPTRAAPIAGPLIDVVPSMSIKPLPNVTAGLETKSPFTTNLAVVKLFHSTAPPDRSARVSTVKVCPLITRSVPPVTSSSSTVDLNAFVNPALMRTLCNVPLAEDKNAAGPVNSIHSPATAPPALPTHDATSTVESSVVIPDLNRKRFKYAVVPPGPCTVVLGPSMSM